MTGTTYLGFLADDLRFLLEALAEGRNHVALTFAWSLTKGRTDLIPRLFEASRMYQDDLTRQQEQKADQWT